MSTIINATTTNGVVIEPDNSGSLQLQTNSGTTAVTIDTSQNVGIGTTSPAGAGRVLNIQGSASSSLVAGSTSNANFVSFYSGQTADPNPSIVFNNSLRFGTATSPDTTGYAERMRIDSSGRVTMSEQPRFLADRSSDQTGYNSTSTGDVVVIYNATTQNVGSHFSTSTGKFTAPVAGMYLFQGSAYSLGGTNFTQAWLVVNGARAIYTDTVVSTTGSTVFSATFLIYLSANDTVGYHPYNSTNTNQTITAAYNHTWFKGYLIS